MKVFDAHCDTIEKLCLHDVSLYENEFHCDLKRMESYDGFIQVFACFVPPAYMGEQAFSRANQMLDAFSQQAKIHKQHIAVCGTVAEIERTLKKGKIGGILSLEGGSPLNGRLENLDYFYQKGVRLITLTWNHPNELGCGAMTDNKVGLTVFGKQVVKRMHHLGMIVDVSHLSDRGFYDVCDCDAMPFVASHSNARAICDHPRNLPDAMIREIARRGGVIGLNLYPPFVGNAAEVTVDHVIAQAEHILEVGGEDVLGLGCDFDGIDATPKEVKGVQDLNSLFERLAQRNYSHALIEKIAYGNFMSFLHNYRQYIKIV